MSFYEWGNPQFAAQHGFAETSTYDAAVLEAAGVGQMVCNNMKCFAVTLSHTSLASAGTVVEWGQDTWTNSLTDAQIAVLQSEGINRAWGSSRDWLV
eukprot:COSAG06_NODE_45260_length_356_cov_0.805447_1_plen_96_part_10